MKQRGVNHTRLNHLGLNHGGDDVRVLIVEDEDFARSALASLLTASGYRTQVAASAEAAIATLDAGCRPDVALVDLDLPGMNGVDFICRLAKDQPRVLPILITAAAKDRISRLLKSSVLHLQKPLNFDLLLGILNEQSTADQS